MDEPTHYCARCGQPKPAPTVFQEALACTRCGQRSQAIPRSHFGGRHHPRWQAKLNADDTREKIEAARAASTAAGETDEQWTARLEAIAAEHRARHARMHAEYGAAAPGVVDG